MDSPESHTYVIQSRDLSEGMGALWSDHASFPTRNDARKQLIAIRNVENDESLMQYRITVFGSDEYYSQPTDKLEY